MYAPVSEGTSNQQPVLVNPWWFHPPVGRTVGHERNKEGRNLFEGGSDNRGSEDYGVVGSKGGIMDSHQQQFCLKWNSFGTNLATAFSNLFQSDRLADVTLFCEGVTFKAHKLILAACSKHFQELFEGTPPFPAGLIVILNGTSADNMRSLLEFMYRGEVHVSQDSLSSFLKAAECLQVKGLSIEHEKLAVAHRHAAGSNNSSTDTGNNNNNNNNSSNNNNNNNNIGISSSSSSVGPGGNLDDNATTNGGNASGSIVAGTGAVSSASTSCEDGIDDIVDPNNEAGEVPMLRNSIKRCRDATPTPAPSPAPAYPVPNIFPQFYESPPKKVMRSSNEVDALGRASVLRDGATFRPASAPQPHLLENHFYQPFAHPSDTPAHSHTAPHTPTELEQELEQARSEERNNCDHKESVAEDLRIKQEPMALTDREQAETLAERLSSEVYSGDRGFEGYCTNSKLFSRGAQMGSAMLSIPPAHPPTTDIKPALSSPAMWNTKINKAGTVSTPEGKKLKCPYCEKLYGYETNLRAHIRQRHQGIRVHCPYCTRTFTRNNTVRRHIAREHKAEVNLKVFQQTNHSVSDSVQQ
ncbi:PREDICTED: protein tramtrack, alpha isoform [Polistes dominula]|uniref:Protein tramtrack, alpha isoform n=1 Tax=Polistes dominula TaxID=743375 RepID=A0ABM1J2E0_POLDO|nr:PREDICTED: protein tramtrack, alpha isoform [Polistes dominula]